MLTLVAEIGGDPGEQLRKIRAAVAGGVDWVQLRDREAETGDLLAFAEALRVACDGAADTRLLINRRVDVALAIGADGAHLGYDAAASGDVRAAWLASDAAAEPLLGVSAHSSKEALNAWRAGADYVHLAPIYPPLSKHAERPPLGLAPLAELGRAGVAVFAQGGIQVDQIPSIVEAGARGIAVTGAILGAGDCERAARELRGALDRREVGS